MRGLRVLGLAAAAAVAASCASGRGSTGGGGSAAMGGSATMGGSLATLVTPALTGDWDEHARDAAAAMEMKYGAPAETGPRALSWGRNGSFKRTVVYRDAVPHAFPQPHVDVLEQTIEYRVHVGFIDDLAAFHGGLAVHRTSGELSVRCENEAMNILALNLANDIVMERRTVRAARLEYVRRAAEYAAGRSHPSTERLTFRLPAHAADPDRSLGEQPRP